VDWVCSVDGWRRIWILAIFIAIINFCHEIIYSIGVAFEFWDVLRFIFSYDVVGFCTGKDADDLDRERKVMSDSMQRDEQVRRSELNREINRRSRERERQNPDNMAEWHYLKVAREVVGEQPELVDYNNPLDRTVASMVRE